MKKFHEFPDAAIIAFLIGLVAVGGCHKKQSAANADPFPVSNQVADWARTGETRAFAAADLWQYIDGDAEKYLRAGVQRTSTADYKFQGKVEAVVDLHTMSNSEGAKAIFESEPAGDARTAAVGDAARLYAQSLVFRKGRYFVRIVAYQDAPQLQQALVELGRGIEKRLAM
jgi:hypothetical protein